MRKIKFRGRDYAGLWHYGGLIHDNMIVCRCGLNVYVEEEAVGQFIGKKDKNGKEIYEGDILQYNALLRPEKFYRYVIAWNPIETAFGCASLNQAFSDSPDIMGGAQIADSIIVGNIHDNPELLKGGAE